MAVELLSGSQLDRMRASCSLAAKCLVMVGERIRPGITTDTINDWVHAYCEENDAYPAPLNYGGGGGRSAFMAGGANTALLLVLTGVFTALPLIWFAAAAIRLPLTAIGMMQFFAPTGQFLLGLCVFGENPPRFDAWIGYGLIWVGVVAVAIEQLMVLRRMSPALQRAG